MPVLPKAKKPNYLPKRARKGNLRSSDVHKSYKWTELSKKIRSTAVCEPCQFISNAIHPSQDVDHIYPLPQGAPYDPANLMPMCKLMHGKKSQLDKEGFRVDARLGAEGLVPVHRDQILIALQDFGTEGERAPLEPNWI
jgi:hypothetical protein